MFPSPATASHLDAQKAVSEAYRDAERSTTMAIPNVARPGSSSSDRTIREYARDIWGVEPISNGL